MPAFPATRKSFFSVADKNRVFRRNSEPRKHTKSYTRIRLAFGSLAHSAGDIDPAGEISADDPVRRAVILVCDDRRRDPREPQRGKHFCSTGVGARVFCAIFGIIRAEIGKHAQNRIRARIPWERARYEGMYSVADHAPYLALAVNGKPVCCKGVSKRSRKIR